MSDRIVRVIVTCIFLAAAAAAAQHLPATQGETLSGKKIVLAETVAGRPAVVIIAFSQAGGQRVGEWMKRIRADGSLSGMAVYPAAMLQGVPTLIRGMVKGNIRNGIPEAERDRFVLLFHDEEAWKQAAGYGQPDDAYVLLVDDHGTEVWHVEGGPAEHYAEFATHAAALRPH